MAKKNLICTLQDYLKALENNIEGTETRKRGQAKIQFSELFGISKGAVYAAEKNTDSPMMIHSDKEAGKSTLLKPTHTANTVL